MRIKIEWTKCLKDTLIKIVYHILSTNLLQCWIFLFTLLQKTSNSSVSFIFIYM